MFPSTEEKTAPIVPAGLHLASFGRRIVGLIVDQVVITAPIFAVFYALGFAPKDAITDGRAVWFTVSLTTLGLAYETIGIWRWGRTLGKLLTRTRAVSVVDGGRLGFVSSFQRSLVPTTVSAIPQVGPILGHWRVRVCILRPPAPGRARQSRRQHRCPRPSGRCAPIESGTVNCPEL